jgi:amino acid transporter
MRRAVIVAIISALLAVTAAAFISGMLATRFVQEAYDGDGAVEWLATGGGGLSGLLIGAIVAMFVAIIFASNATRFVLMDLGVRNPGITMRGPLSLTLGGAIIGTVITIPGILILVVAGIAWGAIRVYDESGDRGISKLTAIAESKTGGLADFV